MKPTYIKGNDFSEGYYFGYLKGYEERGEEDVSYEWWENSGCFLFKVQPKRNKTSLS